MSFPIGFTAETGGRKPPTTVPPQREETPRNCVAEVYFSELGRTLAYYNDRYDLRPGDLVFVEGKMAGQPGRVVSVNYAFKIKRSDYKLVLYRADVRVTGTLALAGSHLLATDPGVVPFEKVAGWLMPPAEDGDVVSGNGGEPFPLDDLSRGGFPQEMGERGREYYVRGWVPYVERNSDRVRALVQGSRPYTVEFTLREGLVGDMTCDCYCPGRCKHQVAALFQLRESLELAAEMDLPPEGYLAAVGKQFLFDVVVGPQRNGWLTLG